MLISSNMVSMAKKKLTCNFYFGNVRMLKSSQDGSVHRKISFMFDSFKWFINIPYIDLNNLNSPQQESLVMVWMFKVKTIPPLAVMSERTFCKGYNNLNFQNNTCMAAWQHFALHFLYKLYIYFGKQIMQEKNKFLILLIY